MKVPAIDLNTTEEKKFIWKYTPDIKSEKRQQKAECRYFVAERAGQKAKEGRRIWGGLHSDSLQDTKNRK